jgi:hypothetical protein
MKIPYLLHYVIKTKKKKKKITFQYLERYEQ